MEKLPERLSTISPSRVSCFGSCRKRFFHRYVECLVPKRDPSWFGFGHAIDAALEDYMQMAKLNRNPKEMIDETRSRFLAEMILMDDTVVDWAGDWGEEPWEWYRDQLMNTGLNSLFNFHSEWYNKIVKWDIIGTQVKLPEFEINGITTDGYIDCLYKNSDGIYVVLDFKTRGKKILAEDFDKYFYQLWFYGSCIGRDNAGKTLQAQIIALIKDQYSNIESIDTYRFTNSHFVDFFKHLDGLTKEIIFAIENDNYPRTHDKTACAWCDYKDMCWKNPVPNPSKLFYQEVINE